MVDWKEEIINEYHALENRKQITIEVMEKKVSISNLRSQIEDAKRQLLEQEREYREDIRACEYEMAKIREDLMERWDIEGKSFKCDKGSATIRTTKSLIITDNGALIDRLTDILDDSGRACDCIRTFDLSAIRKYMDVDLIACDIAHYDEKRNVVISAVKKRRD